MLSNYNYYKSSVWQPAARGHRAYTDLSAARVWGPALCTSLQPCQLGNDSLLNMVLYPLLDMLGGASLYKPLEIPGGFGVAPVIGVSGVATTGRIWAESQKMPLVIGGIRSSNLAVNNGFAQPLTQAPTPRYYYYMSGNP